MDYDIINLSTLQCQMSSFEKQLEALDYYSAYVECEVFADKIRISVRTCATIKDDYHHESFTFWTDGNYNTIENIDTERELLHQVGEYITNLPTGQDVTKQRFIRTCEEARKLAAELDLDDEYVNPIFALAKKIASNILTHRK